MQYMVLGYGEQWELFPNSLGPQWASGEQDGKTPGKNTSQAKGSCLLEESPG